jgi:hypothetical protein
MSLLYQIADVKLHRAGDDALAYADVKVLFPGLGYIWFNHWRIWRDESTLKVGSPSFRMRNRRIYFYEVPPPFANDIETEVLKKYEEVIQRNSNEEKSI